MILGCIGDDFTGSSDLANTLAKEGMRTVQYTGVPGVCASGEVEAGVIALKTRSIEPAPAIEQSLAALTWLQAQGCRQFFFKYCSTFDSTPVGNIGPVAEALARHLGAEQVIVCPAFPGTGRSVYNGHLFVDDKLLNESGMENHPLTPMTDPDIRRWLSRQTKLGVGHIGVTDVFSGANAIRTALKREDLKGNRLIVVDALRDVDLREIGRAGNGLVLITGGSGIAMGLPENFRKNGSISGQEKRWSGQGGKCVVLSGSCSKTTLEQLRVHAADNPSIEIKVGDVICGAISVEGVCDWLMDAGGVPVAFSSADPDAVGAIQEQFGLEMSAAALERFFADLAKALVNVGVERLITAGGETSGAVIEALAPKQFEIGPEIDAGVPALRASDTLVVALKSGNFGSPEFFRKAANILGEQF